MAPLFPGDKMTNTWVVTVEEDAETGDTILPFPEDMIQKCGWQEGDTLDFQINDDNTIIVVNLSLNERTQAQDKVDDK